MDDYQLTLSDYLAILSRRAWLILASFAAVLAVGVAVTLLIPPVYRSAGTILIEAQQIPTDVVQSAVSSLADERIEVIKQRVMTRENLLRIIRKYSLFPGGSARFTDSDQVDVMRKTISVDLVNANAHSDRTGPATIAFSISFEHRSAQVAQAVANDLLTLFLDENAKVRTQRASQTTEFLTEEAGKLKKDLDRIESRIAAYKQEHGAELPENVALGLAGMQRVESDLRQVERDHAAAEDALRALEAERTLAPVTAGAATSEAELQRARTELARLGASYTENHPDLRIARRRVETLEQAVLAEAAAPRRPIPANDPAIARIDSRATALRQRIRVLDGQRSSLRAKLGQLDVTLVRSPQVERGLLALTRDYQAAQKKYEEIVTKRMTAQVAENLEDGQKAERFRVLEPSTLPDRPVRPDRKKLLTLSVLLALGSAAGAVAFMEALQRMVRGAGQVSALMGQEPLVIVPVIPTAAEVERRRKLVLALVGGAMAASCLALILMHLLVLPLDLLFMKAITRLG
ncbi:hypothetical protein GCM10028796_52070 [Ramlibacter monticola]|uniref:Polysaccharide chain length determinant N-terminal domain-containing protein n=1 Tax=Ramlibacter monticola TaxID=1926872 RepID=A0A937CT06_9BURK|nr:Wzz/FepE/Etk N-terminal domain-containing protein [Ramlibacter monticola]MBL0392025.1 hypothetical protein [Ramlibacter monticola]